MDNLKKIKSNRAFTLIEISIVLVIISLLIGIISQTSGFIKKSLLAKVQILTKNSPVLYIEGLELWLETSLESSFEKDIENDDIVKIWYNQNSKSYNKNNATNQITDTQPKYISNVFNNVIAGVRFDGDNDILQFNDNQINNNFTIFIVAINKASHQIDSETYSGTGGTTQQKYILYPGHGGSSQAGVGISMGINGISSYEHGSNYMPALAVYNDSNISTKANIFGIVIKNKQHLLYLNGSLVRTGLTSTRSNSYLSYDIGGGLWGYWQGDIAEFIIYDRILKESEKTSIENYLSKKYNIKL